MRVTYRDLSERSDIGIATISRFMNGKSVKQSTKYKIIKAAQELGMDVDNTVESPPMYIGILIHQKIHIYSGVLLNIIQKQIVANGFHAQLILYNEDGDDEEQLGHIYKSGVSAVIAYLKFEHGDFLSKIQKNGIIVVTHENFFENGKFDQVITNNHHSTYSATEYLIERFHRRIALVNRTEDVYTNRERTKGFIEAMRDHNLFIDHDTQITTIDEDPMNVEDALEKLIYSDYRPTAILSTNYFTTVECLKAFRRLNISLPDDISFLAYDNFYLNEVTNLQLSVVVQDLTQAAKRMLELVEKRLAGDYSGFPIVYRVKANITNGMSVNKVRKINL